MSFGDNKFVREVQFIQANKQGFGKDVHSDMFGAWFLRRAFVKKKKKKGGVTFPPQTGELCLFYAILQTLHRNPDDCIHM